MATILELDQGNTRCKWRMVQGDAVGSPQITARGCVDNAIWQGEGALPEAWLSAGVDRARIANVAGQQRERQMGDRLRGALGVEAEFARVTPECGGVICAYAEPQRLGVDRWLAVLAAHARDPSPALVVDFGSAVTLDLLGAQGVHLGGYIVPGLGLMRRALYQDTDAVKVAQEFAPGMSLAPGRDTASAVNRGLPLMVLGAVERALEELRALVGGEAPKIWLTGGDAALFTTLAPLAGTLEHCLVPDLVMDGLALTNP